MHIKLFLLIFLIFVSTNLQMVLAQKNLTFEDWDANRNGVIARSEFVNQFTENYVDDWNVSDDKHLDDEDFYIATFDIWDIDMDTMLSNDEWSYGYEYYFGEYITDNFLAIDRDHDGYIENEEYFMALSNSGFYESWDMNADSYLNQYELARMLFNSWDYDSSGYIELDEYKALDKYYLDF